MSAHAAFLRASARQLRAQLAALAAQADAFDAQADALDAAPAAAPSAPAPLLTPSECASALGLSVATLNRRVNERIVPVVTVGDSRRYDLAAVRAALSAPSTMTRALPPAPDSAPAPEQPAAPSGVRRVSIGGRRARAT